MKKSIGLLLAFLSLSANGQEKLDIGIAQSEMHDRISKAVQSHANKLGLSQDVITYCRIEADKATDQFPQNGTIPFGGVNYNQITDRRTLDVVIYNREAYLKTYIMLCLSRAKSDFMSTN